MANSRLRVATSGGPAYANDFAQGGAPGMFLERVPGPGPGASIGQSGVFWNNPLSNLAFTVQAPVAVVGAKAGNAALTSLCSQLAALGVIRDNTT